VVIPPFKLYARGERNDDALRIILNQVRMPDLITGVSTSGCVRASATDALNHGFRPKVVRQACADRSPALHENNLADLDAKYADVVDLDEAVPRLRGRQM
jgi:isochorismate hydrolase